MRFLLDANLPYALQRKLAEAGHVGFHVVDRLSPKARDSEIAREANALEAILVSKDRDFVDLSMRGVLRLPLLWIRLGNMTTPRLWTYIEPVLADVARALESGERIIEIGSPTRDLHSGSTSPR